jgi:hypothetical protein
MGLAILLFQSNLFAQNFIEETITDRSNDIRDVKKYDQPNINFRFSLQLLI